MTAEPVRELLRTLPFVPFDLHLADGKVVSVKQRDFASPQPAGRILIVWKPSGEGFEIIDLQLVKNMTVPPSSQSAA